MANEVDNYTGRPKLFVNGQPSSYDLTYDDFESFVSKTEDPAVFESSTAPVNAVAGTLWWHTKEEVLYLRTTKDEWKRVASPDLQIFNAGTF